MLLDLAFLIPAFPLLGFLVILVAGRRLGEPGAGWVATMAMGGSFAAAAAVFLGLLGEAMPRKLDSVGTIGVGLEDMRPG